MISFYIISKKLLLKFEGLYDEFLLQKMRLIYSNFFWNNEVKLCDKIKITLFL